jgi:hypothetical protein
MGFFEVISICHRILHSFIASFLVALGIVAHSEWGYLVPLPERHSINRDIEVRAIFYGWPVRYQFLLTAEDGRPLLLQQGDSARDLRDIRNAFPWGLFDHRGIDEFLWNISIWIGLILCTFTYTMFPLVTGWQFRNFSIAHLVFVITYIGALLQVSYGELHTWTHLPIAYGVCCFVVELVRFPSRLLVCHRYFVNSLTA